MPARYEVTAEPEAAGQRLDRLLAARLPALSRSRLKALIEDGRVSSGGKTLRQPAAKVKAGQTFAIVVPDSTPAKPAGQAIDLEILYEDRDVIVLNKPAGLVVHPAPGNPDRTLVNALIAHCGDGLTAIGGVQRPGIVHRLDKDTSGVMIAAKSEVAHRDLVTQFAAREIERAYQAVVWGRPEPRRGEISGNIARSPRNRKKMAMVARGGKPATTRYRMLRDFGGGLASLLECRLLSGRTHQIRVHLSARGHPLLGDPLYGRARGARIKALPPEAQARVQGFPRQALHATLLGFVHPTTREILRFETALPGDIKDLISCLESL